MSVVGMSEKQAKGIEEQDKLAQVEEVQTVKEEMLKPENKKCYRCGENYPHKGRPCPALNETCKHCHKRAILQKYAEADQIT